MCGLKLINVSCCKRCCSDSGTGVGPGYISACMTCLGKKLRTPGLCPKMGHGHTDATFLLFFFNKIIYLFFKFQFILDCCNTLKLKKTQTAGLPWSKASKVLDFDNSPNKCSNTWSLAVRQIKQERKGACPTQLAVSIVKQKPETLLPCTSSHMKSERNTEREWMTDRERHKQREKATEILGRPEG